MHKPIWKSKTFWFNLLSGAAALSGSIPLKPEHSAIVVSVVNIALRLATTTPAKI
jgi:hypothetical protein